MKTMIEKEPSKKPRKLFLAAGIVLLAVIYLILCVIVDENHTLPGMRINGIRVGGKTEKEIVKLLKQERKVCRENAVFTVTAADTDYQIQVGDALDADSRAFAANMFRPGKSIFAARGLHLLRSLLGGYHLEFLPELKDPEAIHQSIVDSGILESATTTQTSCILQDQQLIFTMGVAKVKLKDTLRYLPAYLGLVCICLLLLIFFEGTSTFLPNLLFAK